MWKREFGLRFGFELLRRAVSLDNIHYVFLLPEMGTSDILLGAISDGLTTHPGRADSNTHMCFKQQKPGLACFARVFWCTFRLCFVMKQEKQLRKQ